MTTVSDAEVPEVLGIDTESQGIGWRDFSMLERWTKIDIACALIVFAFVCELTTSQANRYAPTLAPLVAIIPLGFVMLVRDALGGHRASRLALLFLGSGLISALLSAAPTVALLGATQRHTSWLVFVGGFCAFALGRRVSPAGMKLVAGAFVLAVCLSGAMAVLEVIVQPTSPAFALILDRPRGLTLHPVYLAQFSAGVCGLACWRIEKDDDRLGYLMVGVMSLFIGLAASRVAMLSMVVFVALTVLRSHRRSKRVWLLPAVAFLGIASSWALHSVSGTSQSVVDRGVSSGIQDRLDVWSYGLRGWLEHPIFGWGPGRFAMATQGYFDPEFALRFEPAWWDDAHNVLVEVLTSWGLVGLAFFVLFSVAAVRSSRGPMLWAAGGVAISWLLEPATPATLGILGVMLGIASMDRPVDTGIGRLWQWVTGALVALGIAAATLILVGGTKSQLLSAPIPDGPLSGRPVWYRNDWVLASYYAESIPSGGSRGEVKKFWAQRAVDLEPENSYNHALVALIAWREDDLTAARISAERAVELQPTRELALLVLRDVAIRDGDTVRATELSDRLCEVNPDVHCEPAELDEQ